ncbi:amine sulfotransferase-like isoform X2 [Glandiceps talaboti]
MADTCFPLHDKEPVIDGIKFPKCVFEENLRRIQSMEVRDNDIWLISYPKTGKLRTEIISMMPLEERRYIATHLLPWFMPKQYLEKKPKTLYITRNPKDTALSLWHFAKIHDFLDTPESWDTYLEDFIEGNVIYGSLADHVVSWWNLHHEMDLHVMFLTYESLQKDLKGNVLRISRFLGETLTEERAAVIAERCTFDRMKALSAAKKEYDSEMIYRQGITAGWKTRFTVAQSERVDAVYKEKMKDLDYQYEYD